MRLSNINRHWQTWLVATVIMAVIAGVFMLPAPQAQAHQSGTYHEFELQCQSNDWASNSTSVSVNEGDDFDLRAKWHQNSGTGTWKAHWDTNQTDPVSAEEDVDFEEEDEELHSKSRAYSTFKHTFHTKEDNRWEGNETFYAGYSAIRPSGGTNRAAHYCLINIVDDDPLEVTGVKLYNVPANSKHFQIGEWIHVIITASGVPDLADGQTVTLQFRDDDNTVHERQAEFNVWGTVGYAAGNTEDPGTPLMFSYQLQAGDPKADTISVGSGFSSTVYGLKDDGTTSSVELAFSGKNHIQTEAQADGTMTDPTHYGIDARPRVNDISVSSVPQTPHLITDDRGDTWIYIDTYRGGEDIELTAKFDQPVRVEGDTGISIRIGSGINWRGARYASGSGTDTLVYSYTVKASDRDDDGISIDTGGIGSGFFGIGKILSNTGSIEVNPSYTGTSYNHVQKVDGRPIVTSVSIDSEPETGDTYGKDETIEIGFQFNNNVDVAGTPVVPILLHYEGEPDDYQGSRNAGYLRGSGTDHLTFGYRVKSGDLDTDGVSMHLGGGDYNVSEGTVNAAGTQVAMNPAYSGFWNESGHKVDAVPPKVTSLAVTSDPGPDGHYVQGDEIEITVQFDKDLVVVEPDAATLEIEKRTVTSLQGITLTIGIGNSPVLAWRDSEEGTASQLVFSYTVRALQEDADGIEIKANAISAGTGSTIQDSRGNDADLDHSALANQSGHKVDANPPTATAAAMHSIPDADNTYYLDEKIQVKLTFSENVTVTGSPQLTIDLDGSDRTAAYEETDGADVIFAYTVADGDESTYGVAIKAHSLELNGGSIRDAVSNDAILRHPGTMADGAHQVDDSDKTGPKITGLAFTSTPASGNTYGTGEVIETTVTFNEDITVTGTPQLELFFDGDNGLADYTSSSGTSMVFQYTVKVGDSASDGLAVFANKLTLNGGTIKDAADNDADLSHATYAPFTQYVNGAGGV